MTRAAPHTAVSTTRPNTTPQPRPHTGCAVTPELEVAGLDDVIARHLRPHLHEIDAQGMYPRAFMQRVGELGGFAHSLLVEYGGSGQGIASTLRVMEEISRECLSTGFCVWCHTVCGWYIQHGESKYLKEAFLPRVASGEMLAGTGLSNPMKHFAGIEKIRVTATRRYGGFTINGALPWVSNVGIDHCFAFVAKIEGEDAYLMAVIPGDISGLSFRFGGHFIALEGSSTYSVVFRDLFCPDDFVLAAPCHTYVARIRPGFILTQTGFALGLVSSCIGLMRRANTRLGHVNCFLDDDADLLEADLQVLRRRVYTLADEIGCGEVELGPEATLEAIACRVLASELSLRSAQAAMLHMGAAGYMVGSAAERKLRESYFVAIVTPALKHLKKLQHDLAT